MSEDLVTLSDLGVTSDDDNPEDAEATVESLFADVDAYLMRSTVAVDTESDEESEDELCDKQLGEDDPILRAAMDRCASDMRELRQLANDTVAMLPVDTPRDQPEQEVCGLGWCLKLKAVGVQIDEQVRERRAAIRAAEQAERAELVAARERLQSARRARAEAAEEEWKVEAVRREEELAARQVEAEAEAQKLQRAVEEEAAQVRACV